VELEFSANPMLHRESLLGNWVVNLCSDMNEKPAGETLTTEFIRWNRANPTPNPDLTGKQGGLNGIS